MSKKKEREKRLKKRKAARLDFMVADDTADMPFGIMQRFGRFVSMRSFSDADVLEQKRDEWLEESEKLAIQQADLHRRLVEIWSSPRQPGTDVMQRLLTVLERCARVPTRSV